METTEAADGVSVAQDSYAATEELMMAEATGSAPLPEQQLTETNLPEVAFSPPAATEVPTDERTLGYTTPVTETPTTVLTSTPVGVAEAIPMTPPGEIANQPASDLPEVAASPIPYLRYAEVGLGVLVVLFAVATWLTRKG